MLRWYQQEAVDATWSWMKKCFDPCIIEAATGAGKSHIIAEIAGRIKAASGKKVLVIAPTAELVEQNHAKMEATGHKASIFCSKLGRVETRHDIVFGTPETIKNKVRRFQDYAAVILDEAHRITPTVKAIIESMRESNPRIRVIGLSATPYRLGDGYIYGHDIDGSHVDDAINPYFHSRIYEIKARTLIDEGFLTPPVFEAGSEHYDTSGLVLKKSGKWDDASVDRAFVGQGRKTAAIVADVISKSRGRMGVMFFAQTIQHAKEIMESLPPEMSRMVIGDTETDERAKTIKDFKARKFKYLVNVSVLTTGFDAPHVDVIAILRATESVNLLQQIIGRGLRLHEEKRDCLILDYAENVTRHCPGGDVFAPVITASKSEKSEGIQVTCPSCSYQNTFAVRPNPDQYPINADGYWADLSGIVITQASGIPMPGHLGRRCQGQVLTDYHWHQCGQRWSSKECPECGEDNDIAARYCRKCKAEIVDPNEKLKELAVQIANDPYRVQIAPCMGMQIFPHFGPSGEGIRVQYDIGNKFINRFYKPGNSFFNRFVMDAFGCVMHSVAEVTMHAKEAKAPAQIAYRKKAGTKWLEVVSVIYE